MADRLVVDLGGDGQAEVLSWPEGGLPEEVARVPLAWPLDGDALEDLRWYLEDYLLAPFGVWEERGPAVRDKLRGWGDQVFASVFGGGEARFAYERARDRGLEVVFRSAEPGLLGLPWELMRDGAGPVALGKGGISRSLPIADRARTLEVPGGKLRVLMVISRPGGTKDVGYQVVARPLLERLEAVRGEVELTVLRPPTLDALASAVKAAAEAGEPFHVVHFDGHGAMLPAGGGGNDAAERRPGMMAAPIEGRLAFEKPDGGSDNVGASQIAAVLAAGHVPVVVLNACQSGAVGKELEASVATALLSAGCAAVVAMAYSVYAVAAAEFMAAFYESLFAGDSVGQAVTAGRERLHRHDGRPSPKGDMPLADWLVPVHYMRREVRFPDARTHRGAGLLSLDAALDEIRAALPRDAAAQDPLAAVGAFVGRDDLFFQLEAAAGLQRVVVLTGPGGTGKTELAKGFARWWRDTGGVSDPRLVLWHSFEPGVASFGLDGVITGTGMTILGTDFARLEGSERLGAVKQLLAQFRVLLVWDNFESVREMPDPMGATPALEEAECMRLREFLEWVRDQSASTVIMTSRAQEGWLGQVRRIRVGGLSRAEAAQYAGHLLAPFPGARDRRQRRSFGELLEWLDGHPLAMRLILPRLDATDPAGLLAGLQGTIPLSAEDAGPGRLSSLGACITYSFAHLTGQARRLLPAVSLFHGIADEDLLTVFSAVEGVPGRFADVSGQEWSVVLQDAARVGLLTSLGSGLYQVHPALPGYLAARWHAENPNGYAPEREACEQALCAASADFSRWLTWQVESGDSSFAHTLIGLLRRTLGAMLVHALGHRAWDDAQSIVMALDRYWDTRGLSGEAGAWADRILVATVGHGKAPPTAARSLWLYTTIKLAARQQDAGQSDRAVRGYQSVLAYLQDQPETEWTLSYIAVISHELGVTAQGRGRLDDADDWYRKALAIDEELGNRSGQATTYHQLGMTAQGRGRLDEADDWYRKALAFAEEVGNRAHIAGTYHELGVTAQGRGRLDEAEDWYRKALAIAEELGDLPHAAGAYHQLGVTARTRGRLDEADDWYRKALGIVEELGYRPGIASTFQQLGVTAQARGRLGEAEDWHRKALAINEELGDSLHMTDNYQQLGNIGYLRGRLDEAEDWYRKALAINEELGHSLQMAGACHQLGNIGYLRGRLDEADDWYRKEIAMAEALGDPSHMAGAYHQLGVTAQDRERLDEAEDWYHKALAISKELGDLSKAAMTYGQLGLLAEVRDQTRQALEWTVRCVTLFDQFPHSETGSGPQHLARLTSQLGLPALEEAWQQVTGQPVPQFVRDYLASRHDDAPGGQP